MAIPKVLIIVLGLIVLSAVAIGLTSINHPIILKWVTGSARHHGKPMPAIVYTNGQVNDDIKVYYTDEEDSYLLSLTEYDSLEMWEFLNINLNEKWIGRPAGASRDDYDLIAGHLFQSKTGGPLVPLQDDITEFNFDPQLSFIDGQIKFNLPPNKLGIDSMRIELP